MIRRHSSLTMLQPCLDFKFFSMCGSAYYVVLLEFAVIYGTTTITLEKTDARMYRHRHGHSSADTWQL